MITDERLQDLAENKKLNYLCTDIMEIAKELLQYRDLAELRQVMLNSDLGAVLGGYSEEEVKKFVDGEELNRIMQGALLHYAHHPDHKESETVAKAIYELLSLRKRCAELEAERDAWRKDAEDLVADNTRMADLTGGRDIDEWQRIHAHNSLVQKYPAEPAKNADWTAEEKSYGGRGNKSA